MKYWSGLRKKRSKSRGASDFEVEGVKKSNMRTCYLIDYENVLNNGLKGAEYVSAKDSVHLFYSVNAPYARIRSLSFLHKAKLYYHNVPVGKQSLDMNLVAHLGYLSHKNKDRKVLYVIISKDKGFDRVIQYWKDEMGIVITRRECIEIKTEKDKPDEKSEMNLKVQKVLANAKTGNDVINGVASIVSQNYTLKKHKRVIYLTLLSKYGMKKGLQYYKLVKDLL